MNEQDIEELSAVLHALYQAEARRQAGAGVDEVRHADSYAELAEHTKDYDRVLARFILHREADSKAELATLRQQLKDLREAGAAFLKASNEAAQPMSQKQAVLVMHRWQAAGAKLRQLCSSAILLHDS